MTFLEPEQCPDCGRFMPAACLLVSSVDCPADCPYPHALGECPYCRALLSVPAPLVSSREETEFPVGVNVLKPSAPAVGSLGAATSVSRVSRSERRVDRGQVSSAPVPAPLVPSREETEFPVGASSECCQ